MFEINRRDRVKIPFSSVQMAEDIRPKLEACTVDLHTLLGHVPGYEIEDNKVRRASERFPEEPRIRLARTMHRFFFFFCSVTRFRG